MGYHEVAVAMGEGVPVYSRRVHHGGVGGSLRDLESQ